MVDYTWPARLCPDQCSFSLRTQTGRNLSPVTNTQKVYELSRPLWRVSLSFFGYYRDRPDCGDVDSNVGGKIDALLARLRGGAHRVSIYDFDRPFIRGTNQGWGLTNDAVAANASTAIVRGFIPSTLAFAVGDYVGGDGRPHYVTNLDDVYSDATGAATIEVYPPFKTAIAPGAMIFERVPGLFRLVGDDFGETIPTAHGTAEYHMEFLEDPYGA